MTPKHPTLTQAVAFMQAASRNPERHFDLLLRSIDEVSTLVLEKSRKLLAAAEDTLTIAQERDRSIPGEKTG